MAMGYTYYASHASLLVQTVPLCGYVYAYINTLCPYTLNAKGAATNV